MSEMGPPSSTSSSKLVCSRRGPGIESTIPGAVYSCSEPLELGVYCELDDEAEPKVDAFAAADGEWVADMSV